MNERFSDKRWSRPNSASSAIAPQNTCIETDGTSDENIERKNRSPDLLNAYSLRVGKRHLQTKIEAFILLLNSCAPYSNNDTVHKKFYNLNEQFAKLQELGIDEMMHKHTNFRHKKALFIALLKIRIHSGAHS